MRQGVGHWLGSRSLHKNKPPERYGRLELCLIFGEFVFDAEACKGFFSRDFANIAVGHELHVFILQPIEVPEVKEPNEIGEISDLPETNQIPDAFENQIPTPQEELQPVEPLTKSAGKCAGKTVGSRSSSL